MIGDDDIQRLRRLQRLLSVLIQRQYDQKVRERAVKRLVPFENTEATRTAIRELELTSARISQRIIRLETIYEQITHRSAHLPHPCAN